MVNILLAEDEENLGFMLMDNLESIGYVVKWFKNGKEAWAAFESFNPDLCIIDVMMPKMDGFELAKKIREVDEFTPILFLTAMSQEEDRLKGFEIGGDDYITKPFSMKELDYRIKVFLKRKSDTGKPSNRKIYFGASYYDPINVCYSLGDHEQPLTQMEGKLLMMLLKNKDTLVKREHILEQIWGENDYFKGRSLDVFITRLRKYLKEDERVSIKNHHGVGFSLIVKN